jgi:hypothetical protein
MAKNARGTHPMAPVAETSPYHQSSDDATSLMITLSSSFMDISVDLVAVNARIHKAGKGVFCGCAGRYLAFAGSVALPFSFGPSEERAATREIRPIRFCPAEEEEEEDDEVLLRAFVSLRGSSEVLPSNPRGACRKVAPGSSLWRSGIA